MTRARKRKAKRRSPARLSKARLGRLVEEAVVDCYNESEQRVGLYTMIEAIGCPARPGADVRDASIGPM